MEKIVTALRTAMSWIIRLVRDGIPTSSAPTASSLPRETETTRPDGEDFESVAGSFLRRME